MKTQINSILIPTDFSELSESALKVGIAIAKRQNAEITLLHVVDRFSYLQPTEVFLPDFRITGDILKTMEERLNELAEKIQSETKIKITGKISDGVPADVICQLAYERNISLIVMGTHGTSGLRKFFIGSVAFTVVKNTACPVLTIPGNWQKTDFEKVIFPIRLKPGALEKYFYARPIIEKNNSELFLLGLSEKRKPYDSMEISMLMYKLKVQLNNDKVEFQSSLSQSKNFPSKIIETAKEKKADLIILTANLDYDFKAYFVGPFTQQVVNHAQLPVLSIKPVYDKTEQNTNIELAEKWGKTIDFSQLGMQPC